MDPAITRAGRLAMLGPWRQRGARRWSGRTTMVELPVFPLLPPRIPGPAVIVVTPVDVDRERHDGDAESRRIRIKWNVTVLVGVTDIRRVHPSADVLDPHIAPTPIVEATHHLDGCVGIELSHHGVRAVRPRIKVCRPGSNGIVR